MSSFSIVIRMFYKIFLGEIKMKTTIIMFISVLLAVPCKGIETQAGGRKPADEQLQWQEKRLTDINDTVLRQRQEIENSYAYGLSEVKKAALLQARTLKLLDRMLWTEFLGINSQEYFSYTARTFLDDERAFELRIAMIDSYFLDAAANLLTDDNAQKQLREIANSNEQNCVIRGEAQKILNIMDDLILQETQLRCVRDAKLGELSRWKNDASDDVIKVIGEIKAIPEKAEPGMINAIIYNGRNSLCMIEGVDEIVRQGDTINNAAIKNVKVSNIDRYKVVFQKNGLKWTQVIGQTPKAAWK